MPSHPFYWRANWGRWRPHYEQPPIVYRQRVVSYNPYVYSAGWTQLGLSLTMLAAVGVGVLIATRR